MFKGKKILTVILLLSFMVFFTSCMNNNDEKVASEQEFMDSLGRKIVIPETPEKIISLSPAITEIIYALGIQDKLVGTTTYCDYPEEAKEKPKIGSFEKPNFELILDKEPDLVLVAAGIQKELIQKFTELNVKVFVLDASNVEDVMDNINLLGDIMAVEEKADEITDKMQNTIDTVKDKVKDAPKPLVFFEIWDNPLMSAGAGTFIDDLINLAGGINLAGEYDNSYPQISPEILLAKNPDIYFTIKHQSEEKIIENIKSRESYQSIKAVKNNRIYVIEDDWVTLPGPRIVKGLEAMAQAIHPELLK